MRPENKQEIHFINLPGVWSIQQGQSGFTFRLGTWADGLLTTTGDLQETALKVQAFLSNGGVNKPVYLQYSFSYAASYSEAIYGAWQQWRSNLLPEAVPIYTQPEDLLQTKPL